MTNSKDIVQRLRERAALAAEEGDMTAKCDAKYFSQSADRIEALEAEAEVERLKVHREDAAKMYQMMSAQASRMRDALTDAIETMELAERIPFIDPDYGHEIEALGRRIGFGALMTSASASWSKVNVEMGLPAGGHIVSAPCHATVLQSLAKMRKALEQ